MIRENFLKYASVIVASLLGHAAMAAVGDLLVTITNCDERPLAGAEITVEPRHGAAKTLVSDADGTAMFEGLDTGFYRVSVRREGYRQVAEPSVRVVRNRTAPVTMLMSQQAEAGMEEVVVVAERARADSFGSVSTTYFDRERLRTAVGSGADVMRALDGAPGLFSSGEFSSFTVRGLGPRDNLILIDGFPYEKVVHFDQSIGEQEDVEGGGRYSIFAPNLIEGAEFTPGGYRAAYGGRNASLLQLDVAKGNPSPSASLRVDLAGMEVIYDGPSGLHDDTSVIFTARHFDFGRFFETIDEIGIGDPELTDVILKTHTRLDADNEIEFLLLHTPETYVRDVEHVLAEIEERELTDIEQDSTLVGMTWTHRFGDDGSWENRFYHRISDKISREGIAFPNSTPMVLPAAEVPVRRRILTLVEDETEIGWRSDLSLGNDWGVFDAGLRLVKIDLDFSTTLDGDWIRYAFDTGDTRPDLGQRYIVLTPEQTNSQFTRGETQYAAYAEQLLESGRWDFRAGLRYEHDGFSDEGNLAPRLAANYHLSPTTRLSVTAGTFYQSPRFLDRAADPSNANLSNERLDHLSVGIDRLLGNHLSLLVEVYYRRLDDLVVARDAVTGMASNAGDGRSHGFDVVVNRYFADGWSANMVYSYNDVTLNDHDGAGEYPSDDHYEHRFGVGARFEINARWQLSARWKYATGRPRDAYVLHEDVLKGIGGPLRYAQEFTTNNTLRWDDFHTLNARVDYRRSVGPVDVVAFLDVINLYGSAASDELEFNTATGTIIEDGGEPFPLIGLRFERTW